MATVRNAFSLLGGADEAVLSGAPISKAKKSRKKKGAAVAPETAPIDQSVPSQPIQPQNVNDAGPALEASAVAAVAGEFSPLALQWTDQVLHGDTLYIDGNHLVDFKKVLLQSRALELLVEGCVSRGATATDAPALAQLLAAVAHPAVPQAFTDAVAQAVASLGEVCATDWAPPTPAAKRSALAALWLVLRGVPKPPPAKAVEPPAAALKRLGGELSRQEGRLAGTSQPKELIKAYSTVLDLLCSHLDVLHSAGGTAAASVAPEVAAALKPIDELRASLASRLQEVQAPKPQLSVAEQLAAAEAVQKKNDAALVTCLSDIEFRIVSLEAELALLKREAGDLRARRAAAQQHHEHRLQAIRSGRPESGASPAEIAAAVSGGLASLHGLSAALLGGEEGAGRGEPAAAAAAAAKSSAALGQQVMEAEVPIKLLGAMQQVVELSLLQLHELGGKARFFQERLAKAIKQGEQAAKLGLGDAKTFKQQRSTAETNVKEVMAAAGAAAAAARAAVSSYCQRLPAMQRLPSFVPPPPEYLAALEAKAAEAEAVLGSIRSGSYVPAPAPAVAAAAAAPEPAAGKDPGGEAGTLEARLAALEAENEKKDAQIAAMVSSSTLEVPSPLANRTSMPPSMLSALSSNKPIGPASPPAPAAAPAASAAAAAAALSSPEAATEPASPAGPSTVAAPAQAFTFSQALLQQPQTNGRKPAPRPPRPV
ncbi:hypothetical protein ACK3TF_003754 [Chlorella vulgaris]